MTALSANPRTRRTPGRRCAFSLLEVLFALTILVGGVLTASRLIDYGLEAADLSRAQNLAVLLAEGRMAEIESGIGSGSVGGSGEFEQHPGFKYEVAAESANVDGISAVKVKIVYTARGADFDYTLTRWVYQPPERGGFMR
jgi:Tfp pilus assembly protein PilV